MLRELALGELPSTAPPLNRPRFHAHSERIFADRQGIVPRVFALEELPRTSRGQPAAAEADSLAPAAQPSTKTVHMPAAPLLPQRRMPPTSSRTPRPSPRVHRVPSPPPPSDRPHSSDDDIVPDVVRPPTTPRGASPTAFARLQARASFPPAPPVPPSSEAASATASMADYGGPMAPAAAICALHGVCASAVLPSLTLEDVHTPVPSPRQSGRMYNVVTIGEFDGPLETHSGAAYLHHGVAHVPVSPCAASSANALPTGMDPRGLARSSAIVDTAPLNRPSPNNPARPLCGSATGTNAHRPHAVRATANDLPPPPTPELMPEVGMPVPSMELGEARMPTAHAEATPHSQDDDELLLMNPPLPREGSGATNSAEVPGGLSLAAWELWASAEEAAIREATRRTMERGSMPAVYAGAAEAYSVGSSRTQSPRSTQSPSAAEASPNAPKPWVKGRQDYDGDELRWCTEQPDMYGRPRFIAPSPRTSTKGKTGLQPALVAGF